MASSVSTATFRRLILELLPTGHPTIGRTAQRLGIPVRTLQRRLHNAGLSYSELVDEVRCDAACRLLSSPCARVADIARALGFSDPSNFSRAFVRWTGISPREYRHRQAGRRSKRRGRPSKDVGAK